MEPNSPKKIQFSVPPVQNQLDPQAAEHIRKRRPTPATLFIYSDTPVAEPGDQRMSNPEEAQGVEYTHSQREHSAYTPPTMEELQLVVAQHLQKQEQLEQLEHLEHLETGPCDGLDLSQVSGQHCYNAAQCGNHNCPEQNGSDAHVNRLLSAEEKTDCTCTGGESSQTGQKDNLPSPSSVSR